MVQWLLYVFLLNEQKYSIYSIGISVLSQDRVNDTKIMMRFLTCEWKEIYSSILIYTLFVMPVLPQDRVIIKEFSKWSKIKYKGQVKYALVIKLMCKSST